jgi:hypothetical protein
MKQTAVEWLHEKLTSTWFDVKSSKEILEIAKEKEKRQIIDSYDSGVWDVGCRNSDSEKYYNETFKTK